MGLLGKTAIVCQGVGDFDEYLASGRNAFVVPRATDGSHITDIVRRIYSDPGQLEPIGKSLRAIVLERFSVTPSAVDAYLALAA